MVGAALVALDVVALGRCVCVVLYAHCSTCGVLTVLGWMVLRWHSFKYSDFSI